MNLLKQIRLFAALGTLLSVSAVAQPRYCIGGDLDHLTDAQRVACSAKVDAVRNAAAGVQLPADWHFVIVCGEQGWKDYSAYAFASDAALQNAQASTNLERHETFLRESRLDIRDKETMRRLLASETARVSHSEELASAATPGHKSIQRPDGF